MMVDLKYADISKTSTVIEKKQQDQVNLQCITFYTYR